MVQEHHGNILKASAIPERRLLLWVWKEVRSVGGSPLFFFAHVFMRAHMCTADLLKSDNSLWKEALVLHCADRRTEHRSSGSMTSV